MGTQFAVVYGIKSSIIHKIIDCSDDPDDSHLDEVQKVLAPGQAMKRFNLADFPSHRVADMQPHIGVPAHSGRCIHIDEKGEVINVIMADHELLAPHYKQRGYKLIQHDHAGIGWKHENGVLKES